MAIFEDETIDKAEKKGLRILGITKQQAEIKVIQYPSSGVLGLFEKSAIIDIRILSEAEIKDKSYRKKRMIVVGFATALSLIALFIVLIRYFPSGQSPKYVHPPIASTEFKNLDYKEVKEDFNQAGFTNIKNRKVKDLWFGILTKDGTVDEIKIDGDSTFTTSSSYNPNVTVIIYYHTFD